MTIDRARELLRGQFGLDQFRPGQAEVISFLLAGRSAAAVFPTGGGKSLCYQLPAQLLPGLTLVVSPLIALMKDQIDALRSRGISAERLDSTRTAEDVGSLMRAVRDGRLRLLYVAPERFNNERFRESIERVRVSLFAVDEAHCISEWGHHFRPDYLKLARFARLCRAERVLALTATATPRVLDDICREFDIDGECAVRTAFYRPNLTLVTTPVSSADRAELLRRRLADSPPGATIVYVTLQRTAEEVAADLNAAGCDARAYHAGMEDDQRAAVQDWFAASAKGIVVATIAFGMGVDKADIRYVYHYNLPKSLEHLAQEVGRAGRDGLPARCELLICPDDLNVLENFAYGDTPERESVKGIVNELFSLGEAFDVGVYDLSRRHDIRSLVVQTLLAYLELAGFFEAGTPFYSRYRFRPRVSSAEILARFEGPRRDFLAAVLATASKARSWFHIDLDQAAKATAAPRDRVVRALDYLGQQMLLEIEADGVRHPYRRLRSPDDLDGLAGQLHRRMHEREAAELGRLGTVLELAAHDGCQVSRLGEHFGEPLPGPCGHCGWCRGDRKPARLLPRVGAAVDEKLWKQVAALREKTPDPLSDPRTLARFLCGLSSPRLSAARLTSQPLFGSLSHVPFPKVMARAAQPHRPAMARAK